VDFILSRSTLKKYLTLFKMYGEGEVTIVARQGNPEIGEELEAGYLYFLGQAKDGCRLTLEMRSPVRSPGKAQVKGETLATALKSFEDIKGDIGLCFCDSFPGFNPPPTIVYSFVTYEGRGELLKHQKVTSIDVPNLEEIASIEVCPTELKTALEVLKDLKIGIGCLAFEGQHLYVKGLSDISCADLSVEAKGETPFLLNVSIESIKLLISALGKISKKEKQVKLLYLGDRIVLVTDCLRMELPIIDAEKPQLPETIDDPKLMDVGTEDFEVDESVMRRSLGLAVIDFENGRVCFSPVTSSCQALVDAIVLKDVLKKTGAVTIGYQGNLEPLVLTLGKVGSVQFAVCDPSFSRFGI
jgi:hypothetical protein